MRVSWMFLTALLSTRIRVSWMFLTRARAAGRARRARGLVTLVAADQKASMRRRRVRVACTPLAVADLIDD